MHIGKFMAMPLLLSCVLMQSEAVYAAGEEGHPDWPCVQRRVPTISAATMWAEPPLDAARANDWRKDPEISTLVKRLAQRRVTIEEAGGLLDKFVAPLSDAQRLEKLPLVFQGVLQLINQDRVAIIDGIERFTRRQRDLANQVRKSRAELEKALGNTPDTKAQEDTLQKLDWQTRIHLEREKSLEFVCESPTLLEQRAFALAQEIQFRLP